MRPEKTVPKILTLVLVEFGCQLTQDMKSTWVRQGVRIVLVR